MTNRRSPFDDWMALWRGAAGMAETGVRLMEVGNASAEVIARRCRTMAEGARDPLHADHAEMGRMVPEKVDAMGKASLSMWADMAAVQAEMQAGFFQAARAAMSGRAFGPAQMAASVAANNARAVRIAERSMGAGGRALAPFHAGVTGNVTRLRKRG